MKKKRSMSAPNPQREWITRADLKAALKPLATKHELKAAVDELRASMAVQFGKLHAEKAGKDDLEQGLMGVLKVVEKVEATLRKEFREDIARFTSASAEHVIATIREDIRQLTSVIDGQCQLRVAGVDEKYADLPGRVSALEASPRR